MSRLQSSITISFMLYILFFLINNKTSYRSHKKKATHHLLHAISTHIADEENLIYICCSLKHEFLHSY